MIPRGVCQIGTGLELDQAVSDLKKAASFGGDAFVAKKLKELQQMRQKQKKTDKKTFTGMFNRGEVYNENEDASSSAVSQELPDDPVEKQIHDAEQLVGIYERQEKWDKAEDLKKTIEQTKKQVRELQ